MDNQKVFVLQQDGLAVNKNKPQEVLVQNDKFDCPNENCSGVVHITYWADDSGRHPNFGLRCNKCGSSFYILK